MVVWVIGLSGSGKTTLSERIVHDVRRCGKTVILLDGDQIRELFNNDIGHDLVSRRLNAERICRLCGLLDAQGIHVVCAILSIFPESRQWCRTNLRQYYEVFIDTPIELLRQRDPKGLYARHDRGEITNVAGLDLHFPWPSSPDLIIENSGLLENLLGYAPQIAERICTSSQ